MNFEIFIMKLKFNEPQKGEVQPTKPWEAKAKKYKITSTSLQES